MKIIILNFFVIFPFSAGRLIGTVKTSLEFLVDLDEDEYPVEKIADCNCSSALTIEADIYFALDIYTPG